MRWAIVGDERLARLVGEGKDEAFTALYERYHQPLYGYCRSIVRNETDAQDALQSAFAGAFAALRRGQRDAPVRPWLFRIAHNEAVSLLRRRRPEAELSDALEHVSASVEDQAHERARLALLLADLRELPERQRGALVMRELSGLSHDEIAIALGTSVGAAKQTIFEARRSLSEFEEGRRMACEDVCRAISDADGRALRARRVRAHLRECSSCAAFANAIPARTTDLRALAPPLPAAAAAALLARTLGSGSTPGGAGIGGIVAGATGKTGSAFFASKVLAGIAVVGTASVGATVAIRSAVSASHPATTAPAMKRAHTGTGAQGLNTSSSATGASTLAPTPASAGTRAIDRRGAHGSTGTTEAVKRGVHRLARSGAHGSRTGTGAAGAAAGLAGTAAGVLHPGASGSSQGAGTYRAGPPTGHASKSRGLGPPTTLSRGKSGSHSTGQPLVPGSGSGSGSRASGTGSRASGTGASNSTSNSTTGQSHTSNAGGSSTSTAVKSGAQGTASSSTHAATGTSSTATPTPPSQAITHRQATPPGSGS
jgi:RNA polymerase sigma factor (sigma-70 family)